MVEEDNNLVFVLIGELFVIVFDIVDLFLLLGLRLFCLQMKLKVSLLHGKLHCLVQNLQIPSGYPN